MVGRTRQHERVPLSSFELTPEAFTALSARGRNNGAKKREYLRLDESDAEAYEAWLNSKAPVSKPRVVELLAGWYGTSCALCDTDIDLTLTETHPGRWNIDHIVPKSAGGGWTFGNLRLAHRSCNMERSNEVVPVPSPALMRAILASRIRVLNDPTKCAPTEIEAARSNAAFCEANRQMMVKMGREIRGNRRDLRAQNERIVAKWADRLAVAIGRVVVLQTEWETSHGGSGGAA